MHNKPAAICARLFALTIIPLPVLSLGQGTLTMKNLFPFLFLCLHAPSVFAQGTLTPPGAPAPTMKTLDQVEIVKPLHENGK